MNPDQNTPAQPTPQPPAATAAGTPDSAVSVPTAASFTPSAAIDTASDVPSAPEIETPDSDLSPAQDNQSESIAVPVVVASPTASTAAPTGAQPSPAMPIADISAPAVPAPQPAAPTVGAPEAAAPGHVVVGAPESTNTAAPAPATPPKPKGKKKLWFAIGGGALLAFLFTGFAFGYYLPSRPAAMWQSSLSRTGKGLQSVVDTAAAKDKIAKYKATSLKGTLILKAADTNYNGDFTAKFSDKNVDGGLNMTATSGQNTINLSAQLLSKLADGAAYPDSYVKLSGIKSLGLDTLLPGISNYDNQWIGVSADYLKRYATQTVGETSSASQSATGTVTPQELADLSKKVADVTAEYVFTGDTKKAVLTQKAFVGKEKFDTMQTYHYTAAFNQKNLEAYCVALGNTVIPSAAYKKLTGSSDADIAAAQKKLATDCSEGSANTAKTTGTIGVWIDSGHKLIYKVRVNDKDKPENYTEVGQNYKGGNQLSLFGKVYDHDEKAMLNVTADIDLDTEKIQSGLSYITSSATNPIHLSVTLAASPLSSEPAVTAPAASTKIEDVLVKLGITL